MLDSKEFNEELSSDCQHYNQTGSSIRYVPDVKVSLENPQISQLYCKGISTQEFSSYISGFEAKFLSETSALQTILAKGKAQVNLLYQELDKYDKDLVACGITYFIGEGRQTPEKIDNECRKFIFNVEKSIKKMYIDVDICLKVQNKDYNSSLQKLSSTIKAGCFPIELVRRRVEVELLYVLQQFQIYLNKSLGVFQTKGRRLVGEKKLIRQHEESSFHYAKHIVGKIYAGASRVLYKLTTYLHENWDKIALSVCISVGPLLFVSLPAVATLISTAFSSSEGLGFAKIATTIWCYAVLDTPLIAWAFWELIKSSWRQFKTLTPAQRLQRFQKEKWTEELLTHSAEISSGLGLDLGLAANIGTISTVATGVAGAAAGAVVAGTFIEFAHMTTEHIDQMVQESEAPTIFKGIPKFLFKSFQLASEFTIIQLIQQVINVVLNAGCTFVHLTGGVFTALNRFVSNILNPYEAFSSLINNVSSGIWDTLTQWGLIDWTKNTIGWREGKGPIGALIRAYQFLFMPAEELRKQQDSWLKQTWESFLDNFVKDNPKDRPIEIQDRLRYIAKNMEIVTGLLQLLAIAIAIFFAFKKIWDWGKVSEYVDFSIPTDPKQEPSKSPSLRQKVVI